VMSSGVSLKRVIAPIVVLSLGLTGLLVIDQEFVIPPLGPELVRSHDAVPGEETYSIRFISDANGSLICSQSFDVKTATLHKPTIITRRREQGSVIWNVTGRIDAEKAVYSEQTKRWELEEGLFTSTEPRDPERRKMYYASDLTPKDIPIRAESRDKTLLSSRRLMALAQQGAKVRDLGQLYSQKHFRVTDPVMSMVMLMVSLPILVCRDPKAMKSAVMVSFLTTGACMITVFACKMLATESFFDGVMPEFWAWLPVFIFLPVAILELDSMKT
jgi:lipopolysaccharide export system permease protein